MPQEHKENKLVIITPLEDSMGLIIITLFSLASIYMYYISQHDYEAVLTLIIGTALTLIYETHMREKAILERSLDKIIDEIKKSRKYINIKRVDREDMYEDAARVVLGTQEHLLIIQRSPTIFFGPQGAGAEEEFEKAIMGKMQSKSEEKKSLEIIYAFSVYNPKFFKELKNILKTQDEENARIILKKIIDALDNKHDKKQIHFLPLFPEEFPHPLVISDQYIAIWLTEISGNNLYIEFQDKKTADDIFHYYKKKCKSINRRIEDTKKRIGYIINEIEEEIGDELRLDLKKLKRELGIDQISSR